MIIFLPDLCQIIWQSWFCLLHSYSQQEPALANTSRRGKDLMVQESHLERHPSNSPKGGFRFWMPSTNVSFATNPSGDSVALEFDYTVCIEFAFISCYFAGCLSQSCILCNQTIANPEMTYNLPYYNITWSILGHFDPGWILWVSEKAQAIPSKGRFGTGR